jgi:hypothetical protein
MFMTGIPLWIVSKRLHPTDVIDAQIVLKDRETVTIRRDRVNLD